MLSVGPADDVTNRKVTHMTIRTLTAATYFVAGRHTHPVSSDRIASQDGQPRRMMPLMRRYGVAHLTPSLEVHETLRLAPAIPVFESCFAALGHGALLHTDTGPRAVEDLWPGDRVMTASHGLQTLLWRGHIQTVPRTAAGDTPQTPLIRVTAEAMGLNRPATDLILGGSARIAHRGPGARRLTGDDTVFVPASDLVDQTSVIALHPVRPVNTYQLGFAAHVRMMVSGIEVESLHPGLPHRLMLRPDMAGLLMSLFPHKTVLSDFGPLLHPRIALRDLDLFAVA